MAVCALLVAACGSVQVDRGTGARKSWPFQITGARELLTIADMEAIVATAKPELAKKRWHPRIFRVNIIDAAHVEAHYGGDSSFGGDFLLLVRHGNHWEIGGEGVWAV